MKSGFSRRRWLNWVSAGLGGMLAAERKGHGADANYALIRPKDSLKITRLELIPVNSCRTIFLKMYTDAGIVGLGEGTVEGRISTVMAAIKELEPYLVGKDPRQVAHHWQAIYRGEFYRGGIVLTAALGAVDIAMWDIKGKALGVPVYELLGGPTRDGIHIYYAPESVADAVDHMNNMGIKSFKISPSGRRPSRYGENPSYIKQCYDYFAAYRNALGPGADLGCELHGDSPPQTALEIIKALEPLQPWFYEEPVQFENLHSMADIAKKTTIPIATGERMVNKWQFRELLTLEAASFLQPDITALPGASRNCEPSPRWPRPSMRACFRIARRALWEPRLPCTWRLPFRTWWPTKSQAYLQLTRGSSALGMASATSRSRWSWPRMAISN